jgi:hypothetical protein
MTPEQGKLRMAIEHARDSGDIERLTKLAFHILEAVVAMSNFKNKPDNYKALRRAPWISKNWFCFASGTKDYCIGRCESEPESECRVVCGSFVCWSEENYGEEELEEI